jgi:osmotically-inducible protein OsmY
LTGDDRPNDKNPKAVKDSGVISDHDITHAIERRLSRNPVILFDGIDVRTDRGIVHLGGKVDSLLAKDLATDITQETKGVRSVVNQFKVVSAPRPDEEGRKDGESDLSVDDAKIVVRVSDGKVTLTGTVGSATSGGRSRT